MTSYQKNSTLSVSPHHASLITRSSSQVCREDDKLMKRCNVEICRLLEKCASELGAHLGVGRGGVLFFILNCVPCFYLKCPILCPIWN